MAWPILSPDLALVCLMFASVGIVWPYVCIVWHLFALFPRFPLEEPTNGDLHSWPWWVTEVIVAPSHPVSLSALSV